MPVTTEQLQQLQGLAGQYGGANSEEFKNYVNTTLGAGGYDKIVTGLQELKNNGGVTAPVPVQPAPAPVQPVQPAPVQPAPAPAPAPAVKQTKEQPFVVNSIDEFRQRGSKLIDLENLVEDKYKTIATQNPDGSLSANIGDEKFNWIIDNAGNPIKKSLGKVEVQNQKTDPNIIKAQIQNNIIPEPEVQNSLNYKIELAKNERVTKNNKKTPYDLALDFEKGKIIIGGDDYNDLRMSNPELVNNAEKLYTLNASLRGNDQKVENTQLAISEVIRQIVSDKDIPNLAGKISQDTEISTWNNELSNQERSLKELKTQMDNSRKDIEAELKGTGATRGYINALTSERLEDLTKSYNDLLDDYNTTANKVERRTKTITTEYQTSLDLYNQKQKNLQFLYGVAKDQLNTQLVDKQNLENRLYSTIEKQDALALQDKKEQEQFIQQKELLQMQQDYKNANIETSIINTGDKQLLINKNTGEVINSFDSKVEKPNIETSIIQSGDKQLLINKNTGEVLKTYENKAEVTTPTKGYAKLNDNTLYNEDTGEVRQVTGENTVINNTGGSDLMKALASGQYNGKKFFGVYASGDPTGQNRAKEYNNIQNIGIEKDLAKFPNSKITVDMINRAGEQTGIDPVMIATILKLDSSYGTQGLGARNNNPGNVGQFDSLGTNGVEGYKTLDEGVLAVAKNLQSRMNKLNEITGGGIEKQGYTEGDIELLSELANMEVSARNTALKNSGMTLKDVTDYTNLAKQGKIPATSTQKKTGLGIMSDIRDLVNMNDWQDAIGTSTIFPTIPGGDASSAENAISNLDAKLTLPNLGLLKGPMSDKDLAFLNSMSSKLKTTNSDDQFSKNLVDLYNINARINGLPEVKTIDEIKTSTINTTGTSTQSTQYGGKVYNFNQ